MAMLVRVMLACGCLLSATAQAQTTSFKVNAENSQKLSELTPPPERYLPTIYLVHDPGIQAALSIDDQQRLEIRVISKGIRDPKLFSQLDTPACSYSEYSQVTDAQQRRQLELRAARQLHLGRLLEKDVLSPEQLGKLNQLRIRLCGMVYFLNEQSSADLGLTPEQRSLILDQHSAMMRESHTLSSNARKEIKQLKGAQKLEAQQALNKKIGELERSGVARVVSMLSDSQQATYTRLAGPPTELRRESLNMKIAIEALNVDEGRDGEPRE